MKNRVLIIIYISLHIISSTKWSYAEPYSPFTTEFKRKESAISNEKIDEQTKLRRNTWVESARGAYKKTATSFYFSDLYFNLGKIISEHSELDDLGRPISSNQIIEDSSFPSLSQRRLLSNIEYGRNGKPASYREEVFISANDYLSETMVRLRSRADIHSVKYNDTGKPITILGNTEVVISDDKGNSLLNISGSFTKQAHTDISGKIKGYYRYGIDNIVVADGVGEIIITAPPSVTNMDEINEYRVGIVSIKDEKKLREILNNQSLINQLLAKFGLAELFYKAFHTEKFYTSLTYLQIENTPDEIMDLQNITLAFKSLIKERQQAHALFQDDIDAYYNKLAKTLFKNIDLWWNKDMPPQEYYKGNDEILSKEEYRKMVDDAIILLSASADTFGMHTSTMQNILSLEQYLRTQMIMNSKLIYIQKLKDSVSNMNSQISMAARELKRPVLIQGKDSIEALIVLPEKNK